MFGQLRSSKRKENKMHVSERGVGGGLDFLDGGVPWPTDPIMWMSGVGISFPRFLLADSIAVQISPRF
jgi:hypothetical protein